MVLVIYITRVCFLVEEKVLTLCVSGGVGGLAGLGAGVGELLAGIGRDGKSGKVLMTDWWRDETQSHNHESHGN